MKTQQRRLTGSEAFQMDFKAPTAHEALSPHPHQHMTSTSEFISTHIQGKWHLAAVQSKCDWETRIKVTSACVITLGNVFVCSIYQPKGFGFNTCEKTKQHGNIESVSVVVEAGRTNTSRFVLLKYTHVSTNSMCTLCDIVQRGENTFTLHIYRINDTYACQATSEIMQIM